MKTTKTIKTTADIFTNRVAKTISVFKQESDEVNAAFLKAAKENPAWAVDYYGESIVRRREAFSAIDSVRGYIGQVGDEYATRKQAVQACLDYFRNILVRAATRHPCSSQFANGVDFAKREGISSAVTALERLVDHEFI